VLATLDDSDVSARSISPKSDRDAAQAAIADYEVQLRMRKLRCTGLRSFNRPACRRRKLSQRHDQRGQPESQN